MRPGTAAAIRQYGGTAVRDPRAAAPRAARRSAAGRAPACPRLAGYRLAQQRGTPRRSCSSCCTTSRLGPTRCVLRCARGVRGKRGVSVTISAGAIVNSNSAAGRGQQEEEAKHVRGRIEWPAPAPGEGVSVDCYWKEGLARKSGVGADRVLCLVSAPPLMRNQATRQGTNLEINNKGDRSRVFPDSQTRYSRLLMINIKTTSRRYYVAPPHARARAWGRARPVGACCPLTPWYAPVCVCCGVSGGLLRRRSLNWAWCCAYRRLIAPAGRRGLVV